jgi:hypothetical protein
MITDSLFLWLPNKVLSFVLMLFGSPYIPPELRVLITGFIALFMYAHLTGFVLSYIKKLLGMGQDKRPMQ